MDNIKYRKECMILYHAKIFMLFTNKIKVYAFVGPSGTGKSYRAQMVANERRNRIYNR